MDGDWALVSNDPGTESPRILPDSPRNHSTSDDSGHAQTLMFEAGIVAPDGPGDKCLILPPLLSQASFQEADMMKELVHGTSVDAEDEEVSDQTGMFEATHTTFLSSITSGPFGGRSGGGGVVACSSSQLPAVLDRKKKEEDGEIEVIEKEEGMQHNDEQQVSEVDAFQDDKAALTAPDDEATNYTATSRPDCAFGRLRRCNGFKVRGPWNFGDALWPTTPPPPIKQSSFPPFLIFMIIILTLETLVLNTWLVSKVEDSSPLSSPAPINTASELSLSKDTTHHQFGSEAYYEGSCASDNSLDTPSLGCMKDSTGEVESCDRLEALSSQTELNLLQEDINTSLLNEEHPKAAEMPSSMSIEARLQRLELESLRTQQKLAAHELALTALEARMSGIEDEIFSTRQHARRASLSLDTAVHELQGSVYALYTRVEQALNNNINKNNNDGIEYASLFFELAPPSNQAEGGEIEPPYENIKESKKMKKEKKTGNEAKHTVWAQSHKMEERLKELEGKYKAVQKEVKELKEAVKSTTKTLKKHKH